MDMIIYICTHELVGLGINFVGLCHPNGFRKERCSIHYQKKKQILLIDERKK